MIFNTIWALGLIIIIASVLMSFSLFYKPFWIDDGPLKTKWNIINICAFIFSIIIGIITYFIHGSFFEESTVMSLSSTVLSFVLVQTLFTDFCQRLADRRLLRIANFIVGIAGVWFLYSYDDTYLTLLYILLFLGATLIVFLPQIGASDGRAMQLVVLGTFPFLLLEGFQIGLIVFLIEILLFGAYHSIRRKSLRGFWTKISVPMVPLIIFPFLGTLLVVGNVY